VNYFEELTQTLSRLDTAPLLAFVEGCQGTLWVAGNGGSMATAQHWACDLSKAAGRRVQALGANSAVLTAWANDVSYGAALGRELEHSARLDDALIVLSCSGRSVNVLEAISTAQRCGLPVLMICGALAPTYPGIPALIIPHTNSGVIEDAMMALGHALTEALCSR
jgi:D-sedoheptulose 7-phosphate isomerase